MRPVENSQGRTAIYLSGSLAKRFFRQRHYQLDKGDAWEAMRALKATLPGWAAEISRLARLGMRFAIYRNRKNVGSRNASMMELGGANEIRVVPVIHGGKRAGVLQTIVGIVLIVASFFVAPGSQAALFAAGVGTTAGGVIQMLSPQASGLKQSASPDNQPSYAFGSAKNTTASGNPVAICIGERRWGGAIISASILAEDKT
ncbi:putative phage tail protein [Pseudomonas graminis]|uniref:tail assembly protein n=1 Tax=Pseudomonas graminis TaxID=158627 RepID=UPI001061A0FC|nr:tail assembly protein [Pseudomonas graminis]TDV54488.1 putative phage tail protein [Pseudomonas graminis]